MAFQIPPKCSAVYLTTALCLQFGWEVWKPSSPPSHIPSIRPKSCGRVLTSAEHMKIMEEKERVKKSKEDVKRERGGVSI